MNPTGDTNACAFPHRIRLRGPWLYESLPPGPVQKGRVQLPADWGGTRGAYFRGRVRYVRHFNWPGPLAVGERVWLVIEGVDARGAAILNGTWLGEIDGYAVPTAFDVHELVRQSNELVLEVELPAHSPPPRPGREHLPGGPIGEVRLEIRRA
ncbi:MAG: hypothetical protein WD403_13080 [Pirellulales bacterium]